MTSQSETFSLKGETAVKLTISLSEGEVKKALEEYLSKQMGTQVQVVEDDIQELDIAVRFVILELPAGEPQSMDFDGDSSPEPPTEKEPTDGEDEDSEHPTDYGGYA